MEESEKKKKKPLWREYGEAIGLAVVLALIIRTFVIQAFKIPSGSMLPTLQIGDHILVNKFIYGIRIPFTELRLFPLREPKRGDIVVFEFPQNRKVDYIKRLIGEPGDKVAIIDDRIFINDRLLKDPWGCYSTPACPDHGMIGYNNYGPVVVPDESYFMIGDNRNNSQDSRVWGFVPRDHIKGKALIIYFSWESDHYRIRWSRIGSLVR